MNKSSPNNNLKHFLLYPNIVFAVTSFLVLIFELIEHNGDLIALGHAIVWQLLPIFAIIYYNVKVVTGHAKNSLRFSVLVFTGLFFLCYLVDNYWIINMFLNLIIDKIK